jgi:hypothetical protein
MRSLRAELAGLGLPVGADAELADCDDATRFAAYALAQDDVSEALPDVLLDAVDTFADLAHFANVRRSQEGRPEDWTA